MSGIYSGHIVKLRKTPRVKTKSALRMMAIMQESEEVPKEFLETGRTGRRNAMPDILHPQGVETSTADLPSKLQQLATSDAENPQPGTSRDSETKDSKNTTGSREKCS